MSTLGQKFVAELVGTFIFLGVIIHVVNKNEQNGYLFIGFICFNGTDYLLSY